MAQRTKPRHLLIFNQAANYLTIGFANAFNQRFDSVTLLVGAFYEPIEQLNTDVRVKYLNRWHERPAWKKALSYLFALFKTWLLLLTRYRKHEVLFISVPPMGYLLNLFVPNRFSMIIWDLYPDMFKITGMRENHWIYRTWARLNRRSFRKAYRLFTISDVMANALEKYVDPDKIPDKIIVHPIWSVFDNHTSRVPPHENRFLRQHRLNDRFIVQYSGNIGLTHNVEILLDIAEHLSYDPRILIQIIGRGPKLPQIERLVDQRKLRNVQLLPFQTDEVFPHSLSAASVGVVVLDEKVSQGSVPSKAYNLMSFGIPSLYIASGESELAIYAERFGHGRCFSASQLGEIVEFVRCLANDPDRWKEYSEASLAASKHFRKDNAHQFVESYFGVPNSDEPKMQRADRSL